MIFTKREIEIIENAYVKIDCNETALPDTEDTETIGKIAKQKLSVLIEFIRVKLPYMSMEALQETEPFIRATVDDNRIITMYIRLLS